MTATVSADEVPWVEVLARCFTEILGFGTDEAWEFAVVVLDALEPLRRADRAQTLRELAEGITSSLDRIEASA